jgi:hypothetical protein
MPVIGLVKGTQMSLRSGSDIPYRHDINDGRSPSPLSVHPQGHGRCTIRLMGSLLRRYGVLKIVAPMGA